jgi:hypothetical protein
MVAQAAGKEECSFLKKRTKKLLSIRDRPFVGRFEPNGARNL